ncbi:glucuronyl esterase domain-containing protein [Rhodohalobacter sulfatireducens]|uniref:4-O-methyl-glucuronoyl methylesterase-like domain-containing protein n=1 Tax=Rhodohalobacter sulfatireducens TaxID=2911366 RepID=A0ABS9K991_9BACT|nr:hypothetical protein [Rhodohalobacter sulfatireducens]MCG2587410.1 hypothetical protein [Rhodohalobacter sulfatireducens]
MKIAVLSLFILFLFSHQINAQEEAHYDESKVPDYELPNILETSEGDPVSTFNEWRYERRPEIVGIFAEQVYGQMPQHFDSIEFIVVSENGSALNGTATAKEIDITITRNGNSLPIRLNLLIPNDAEKPVPVTLLMNHRGPEYMDITLESKEDFWPAETILQRGYAAAVYSVGDVADDDPDTYTEDILETLYPEQIGQDDGMMALSAWGWGAMRIMDYFETDDDIDQQKSMLVGHSRGGKSALWTGANDERWGIIVANESGAVGAALSKRKFGETVEIINNGFPYWFTPNFEAFNQNESEMPFDQHMLLATIAPRGVYITAAEDDEWADPKGMYESLLHASEVYESIYGISIPLSVRMPAINNPTDNSYAAYHIRDGEHDLKIYDWVQFLNFADRHFHINKTK